MFAIFVIVGVGQVVETWKALVSKTVTAFETPLSLKISLPVIFNFILANLGIAVFISNWIGVTVVNLTQEVSVLTVNTPAESAVIISMVG